MENIKMTFILGLLLLGTNAMTLAQTDFSRVQKAFSESYELEAKGDFKAAADKLKTVYDEGAYEQNLRLGWLNYMAGNFNESLAFYQKSMELMPYADEPRFGYIFPLSALGRWDEVISIYERILENSHHNTKAMYNLGTIYYNRKQYDKALEYFKNITDLYPFDYDGLHMYGWCNLQLGKKKEARLLFEKALLNRPDDISAAEGLSGSLR